MYKFAACISEGPLDVELTLRTPLGASILIMHQDLASELLKSTCDGSRPHSSLASGFSTQ